MGDAEHKLTDLRVAPRALHKQAEIASHERALREARPESFRKPFGEPWDSDYWIKWATITDALRLLGVSPPATILDIGCGSGWTTTFLAECGYLPLGMDLAPAMIEMAKRRAARTHVDARFLVADMEAFSLGRKFEAALVFDALHHTTRQEATVQRIAEHLKPGGWVLFGEPSLLHHVSPAARRTHRDVGWVERGIGVRKLKRDCRRAGLGGFRRFFEGTGSYESRVRGFGWQLIRLAAANVAFAPRASIWLAARRVDRG
jgi:2-polyprenyl-3-methyl-5-hydroxy-6-metoxy-1,4-benzoquinol methylase